MKSSFSSIGLQPGSLNKGTIALFIAPKEWISSIGEPNFSTGIISSITFASGKQWIELEAIPESYRFEEKPKDNKSGPYFEISANAKINQLSPSIQEQINQHLFSEFIAVLKNKSGQSKLVGSLDNGMILNFNHEQSNRQEAEIELTIEQESAAYFFQEGSPVILPTPIVNFIQESPTEVDTISQFKIPMKYGAINSRLVQVKVADKSWLNTNIQPDQNIVGAITLKKGRSWINLQFIPDTYSFQERKRSSKSGHYFEISLNGRFNFLSPESQQVLNSLQYTELIALVMDEQKNIKVLGDADHGVLFRFSHEQPSNQEVVRVSLLTERNSLSPFLISDGSSPLQNLLATEDGEFIITEDGEFLIVE